MKTIAGIIDYEMEKTGAKGKYRSIKVDGTWFNDFEDLFKECKKGDNVEVQYNTNGAFNNVVSVKLLNAATEEIVSAEKKLKKVKVISTADPEEFEKMINDFNAEHNSFATNIVIQGDKIVGVLYYYDY